MDTMTRDITADPDTEWRDVPATAADVAHDEEFAREALAYLRANGLAADEIERALCEEVGLSADRAHELALAG